MAISRLRTGVDCEQGWSGLSPSGMSRYRNEALAVVSLVGCNARMLDVLRRGDAVAPVIEEKVRPRLQAVGIDCVRVPRVEIGNAGDMLEIHAIPVFRLG